jgi:hypothetical protein
MRLTSTQKRTSNQKAMELEAARDILAEVFGVRLSEVDEMFRLWSADQEMWPERFNL